MGLIEVLGKIIPFEVPLGLNFGELLPTFQLGFSVN